MTSTRRARAWLLPVAAAALALGLCTPADGRAAATPTCASTRFLAGYYNNTTMSGTPVRQQCENAPGGTFASSPAAGVNADNFSVNYSANLAFPAGSYAFALTQVNDGARVWLDGALLIDKWSAGTSGTTSVTRSVTAGTHTVRVAYFSTSGTATLGFAAPRLAFGSPSTNGNYFAKTSFWNTKVPSTATTDPNSAAWIAQLDAQVNGVSMNSSSYTTSIYDAPAGTPTASIRITNSNRTITIPYQLTYWQTPDTDLHLAVIDDTNRCLYEFQSFNPLLRTADAEATYHSDKGSGGHLSGPAHAGGELSYLGGLITPQDVSAGVIDHPLRYAIPINAPTYVYPGTRSDGTTQNGVPEGTRLQLDPSLDLRPFGLSPFQLMVAKALQTYGGFDADNSSSFALYARSTYDGTTYAQQPEGLPDSLISHMRFLAPTLSSPSLQLDSDTDTSCAQQH